MERKREGTAIGQPVPVLLNERAGLGSGDDTGARIAEALREQGVDSAVQAVEPHRLDEAIARAARAAPVVAVSGGDGTLLSAAGVLAGGEAALAPLPTGTLNHFSRRLGIGDLAAAARAIAGGRIVRAPLGVMDDRVFLNTATFGVYADVVRLRERLRPRLRKWGAAAVAALVTLAKLREMEVELVVEGESLRLRTPLVWVGVGWGSFPFVHEAPERRAHPDLEIVVVRPRGRLGLIATFLRISLQLRRRDRPVDVPGLEVLHARQLVIRARKRVGVTLDGEVMRCETPLFLAIQDEAIAVVTGEEKEVTESLGDKVTG
jgi:diacylglycerol kinase family enzyme